MYKCITPGQWGKLKLRHKKGGLAGVQWWRLELRSFHCSSIHFLQLLATHYSYFRVQQVKNLQLSLLKRTQ